MKDFSRVNFDGGSGSDFSYDIDELRKLANFFRQQKNLLFDSIKECNRHVSTISTFWQGDPNSSLLVDKFTEKLNKLRDALSEYDNIANAFDQSADALENTRNEISNRINSI